MQDVKSLVIGGRFIAYWDEMWVELEGGLKFYWPQLRGQVGLYRASLRGKVVAIGTGTEKRGGLAKRLSDFIRPSRSGRNYSAGQLMYDYRNELRVEVLITGNDRQAQINGRKLKTPMIRLHKPIWNSARGSYRRRR